MSDTNSILLSDLIYLEQVNPSSRFNPPISKNIMSSINEILPKDLLCFLEITDGLEIGPIPGVVLYECRKIRKRTVVDARSNDEYNCLFIGYYNFGDYVIMLDDGRIGQFSVESGTIDITNSSLHEFLIEQGEVSR